MKKLLFVLPVILLLAAACNTNQPTGQQNPEGNSQQTSQTQQTTPSADKPTETSANTKIYSSDYGYQFTYSVDYTLEASSPKKVSLRSRSNNSTGFYGEKSPADVTIEYFDDLTQLPYYKKGMKDVNDYVAQSGASKLIYNVTSVENKNDIWVISFTDTGITSVYKELMVNNNRYFQISYNLRETGEKLNSSEKQIQQTFKFTK